MYKLKLKVLPIPSGEAGKLSFLVDDEDIETARVFYREIIKPYPENYLSLEISKWYRGRSLNQNSLWHN